MYNNFPKDHRQEAILQILSTQESNVLIRLYFRIKLYAGKEDISLSDMLEVLQIPCMKWGNEVVYRRGEKSIVTGVDRQLKRAFENWKSGIMKFSPDETAALQRCGANPGNVYLAIIAS